MTVEPLEPIPVAPTATRELVLETLPVPPPPTQQLSPFRAVAWKLRRASQWPVRTAPFLAVASGCARPPCSHLSLVLAWLFGAAVLMVGLAILAALPVLQFLSLGYLLEAGGRVARSGRLRDGFIGVWRAALLGSVVGGAYLLLLPVRIVSSLARDAYVIDPGGPVEVQLADRAARCSSCVTALHIAACVRIGVA